MIDFQNFDSRNPKHVEMAHNDQNIIYVGDDDVVRYSTLKLKRYYDDEEYYLIRAPIKDIDACNMLFVPISVNGK